VLRKELRQLFQKVEMVTMMRASERIGGSPRELIDAITSIREDNP